MASFSDTDPGTAEIYSATIFWGDGTISTVTEAAGQIVADGNGGFDVIGSHTYQAGASATTLRVALNAAGRTGEDISRSDIAVADAPLIGGDLTPPVTTEGAVVTQALVYHFSEANPYAVASDYMATVAWGDGAVTTITSTANSYGLIAADPNGGFDVLATHRYTIAPPAATFSVTVSDQDGSTCGASDSNFSVADAPLVADALTPPAALGTTTFVRVPVFTFTDADQLFVPFVLYTATVNWGDGATSDLTRTHDSTSPIVENYVDGQREFVVYGSHTYAQALSGATFSVEVNDPNGASTGASVSNFMVDPGPAVTSIDCVGPAMAVGAGSLQFAVNFSTSVTGVGASDFAVAGGNSTGTISSVTGSGSSYVVTVINVSGNGVLGLNLVDDDSIVDAYGAPLGGCGAGNGNFTGQAYALNTAFYWDADGVSSPAAGGSGPWSGGATWRVGSPTGPLCNWVAGADACFPAGTGTVTIAGQIAAHSLNFEGDGAAVQSSSSSDCLSLVPDAASGAYCGIYVSSGSATVGVRVAGSNGLIKGGPARRSWPGRTRIRA